MTSATPEVVVADTSCLIALSALDDLDLLRGFYNAVAIPPAVAHEYGEALPGWIEVRPAEDPWLVALLRGTLGPGESESIAVATRFHDPLLVLDDLRARRLAATMGLRFTGTLGILLRAKREGRLPSIRSALQTLQGVGFRLSTALRTEALRAAGEPDDNS